MATTGELRAIIEELNLIDAGDAFSYLGEEPQVEDESILSELRELGFLAAGETLATSCVDSSLN